jgi:protein ImuB
MACWIALHLPTLALELAGPGPGSSPGSSPGLSPLMRADDSQRGEPAPVVDTTVVLAQSRVWQASEAAQAAGVQAGMRRGGVLALLPQARFHDRDEAAETVALEALALALLRFGPDVAIASHQCVLIDVAPSLRLFGGLASLAAQILDSADALGHRASLGVAATASAAALLARMGDASDLEQAGADPHASTSAQMQAAMKSRASGRAATSAARKTISPRSHHVADPASSRFFAPCLPPPLAALPQQLDMLPVALLPEAQPWLDWLAQIGCATLGELRALPTSGIRRRCGAALPAALSRAYGEAPEAPAWYRAPPPHLLSLCKERLARSPLVAPVLTLRLDVTQTAAHVPLSGSLLPEPGRARQDFVQLIERMSARLGDEHVRRLQVRGDHRPEAAFASVAYEAKALTGEAARGPIPPRPAWLLDAPQRLMVRDERPWRQGPLQLVSGPERIEAGWWEPGTVTRDYFIAADTAGALLWLFRERPVHGADAAWYLHGLFG